MNASSSTKRQSLFDAWCNYWFPVTKPEHVLPFRIALCSVIAVYFASYFSACSIWFGPDGVLTTSLAAKFVAYEQLARWQVWSPLWWTDQRIVYQAWLLIGILLAATTAMGVGGRWTPAVLSVWMIGWAHRIWWLSGAAEPALIALTAYLIVEPGPRLFRTGAAPSSWLAGLALRLVQTHVWILLAAGLLSQLASLIWWRGDAIWWLTAGGRSNLLSVEELRSHPMWINFLTHACVVVQAATLWLLTTRSGRTLGIACGLLTCAVVGLIADFSLYALVLAAGLVAFAYLRDDRQPDAS